MSRPIRSNAASISPNYQSQDPSYLTCQEKVPAENKGAEPAVCQKSGAKPQVAPSESQEVPGGPHESKAAVTKDTFGKGRSGKEQAKQLVSKGSGAQKPSFSTTTAYIQTKGIYHKGNKNVSGLHAEITAAQGTLKAGGNQQNAQIDLKAGTADVKSLIDTKKRSVDASLSATALEVGGTINRGNFGVGAKVGVGVGASGKISLCDDQNKDGKKEIAIELSGALLGKLGISLRVPNPLGSLICPKQ